MAVLAAIVVAAALLEDDDLFAARLRDDLGRDDDACGIDDFAAVAGQQDFAQRDLVAGIPCQLLDRDLVSGGNPVLLAACAQHCEHRSVLHVLLAPSQGSMTNTPQDARGSKERRR